MKSFAIALILFALSSFVCAKEQDIASCSNPSGTGYYPEIGMVGKADSGWTEEKITNGITKLVKIGKNKYDLLFVDVRKEIISATKTGGSILMLNRSENVVSFIVIYPGSTAEIYTFIKDNSGKLEYLNVLSRAGDNVMFAKSTVMRGDCDYINFDLL